MVGKAVECKYIPYLMWSCSFSAGIFSPVMGEMREGGFGWDGGVAWATFGL